MGKSPYGPFAEGPGGPILVPDQNRHVISPGRHTIFQRDGHDFILYHHHGIPFDPKFICRQVCIDPILFTAAGQIEKITPTHLGSPLVIETAVSARLIRIVFPDTIKGSDISLIEWTLL